jgi:transposase
VVDTLGELLVLHVTPASASKREQVAAPAEDLQQVTGQTVELGFVDQGYAGEQPAEDAAKHGIRLEVITLWHL